MSGRSVKQMVAYIPGLNGVSFTWKTAGDYTHVGLVYNWQANAWEMAAKGWSPQSIAKRTLTAGRRMYAHAPQFVGSATAVTELHEATAPIIAEYFGGEHRVVVTAVFREGYGWQSVRWLAGRSNLRQLARDGYTAIAVQGRRQGEEHVRTADFQMTQIVRSLNTRRASV